MFPHLCLTVAMVLFDLYSVFLVLQTRRVELMPSILVSSDQSTFSRPFSEPFRCSPSNLRCVPGVLWLLIALAHGGGQDGQVCVIHIRTWDQDSVWIIMTWKSIYNFNWMSFSSRFLCWYSLSVKKKRKRKNNTTIKIRQSWCLCDLSKLTCSAGDQIIIFSHCWYLTVHLF